MNFHPRKTNRNALLPFQAKTTIGTDIVFFFSSTGGFILLSYSLLNDNYITASAKQTVELSINDYKNLWVKTYG